MNDQIPQLPKSANGPRQRGGATPVIDAELARQLRHLREQELLELPSIFDMRILAIAELLSNIVPHQDCGQPAKGNGAQPTGTVVCSILHPSQPQTTLVSCTSEVGIYITADTRYDRQHFGTTSGIEALLDYYTCCQGIVRLGVVVTEAWSPRVISRYSTHFAEFTKKGIFTVWLLTNGRRMMPMVAPF